MRRVCSTERYSLVSSRLSAQVSTTWLPLVLTSLTALPFSSARALPERAGISCSIVVSSQSAGREIWKPIGGRLVLHEDTPSEGTQRCKLALPQYPQLSSPLPPSLPPHRRRPPPRRLPPRHRAHPPGRRLP